MPNPNGAAPQRFSIRGLNASGTYNGSLDAHGSNAGINDVFSRAARTTTTSPSKQQAMDGGKMDKFPGSVGSTSASSRARWKPACTANQDLDYYDGNTLTAYRELCPALRHQ